MNSPYATTGLGELLIEEVNLQARVEEETFVVSEAQTRLGHAEDNLVEVRSMILVRLNQHRERLKEIHDAKG